MKASLRIAHCALEHLDDFPAGERVAVLDQLALTFDSEDPQLAEELRDTGRQIQYARTRTLSLAGLIFDRSQTTT